MVLRWDEGKWGEKRWGGRGVVLDIYRDGNFQGALRIDKRTRLIRQLLGEDIIKSTFDTPHILGVQIGDYTIYDSVNYYVNSLPDVKKNATNSFEYNITFESLYYDLAKIQFLDTDGKSDFDLVGDLEDFIDLIVTNLNRIYAGWSKGTCDQSNTDYKLLNFSKENCMQVLQKLCGEFEGEFSFNVKAIDFTDKVGSDTGLTFKYKQGLRTIVRDTLSEKNIVTRLYAFGSEKNLASDYRDRSQRLIFVAAGESYLEKNTGSYGTIEHTEIFEDIYPHRDGTISAVDGADVLKFTDSGMDFNLNDYLLPGVTAKIHFQSGNLGGYEFEISAYDNGTKEFTIIAFTDDQGYEMPNATLKPAVSDKYVILGIELPQSYIDTAETTLQAKTQTYLDDNSDPRVTYLLQPDWRYFQTHAIDLEAGDFITVEDTDLNINALVRIIELTKQLINDYKYTLKLSNHLEAQLIQRVYSEQEDLKKKIEIGEGGDIIRARRGWRTSEELRTMVFDTDGYFDTDNIRAASIETSMISVGGKSRQFVLKNIEIKPNYETDESQFYASAGELIHLAIADAIRTWTLSENTQTSLVDGTAYYIYAKCTKEAAYTGQIIVDSAQRQVDDDATYYYFLIGVLHSVVDGVRGISLTYGQTMINGKFITTGRIQSTDGLTYFDLEQGILAGRSGLTAGLIKSINEKMQVDLDNNFITVKDVNDYVRYKAGLLTGDYGIEIRDSLNELMMSSGESMVLSQKYVDKLRDYLTGSGYVTPITKEVSSEQSTDDFENLQYYYYVPLNATYSRRAQKISLSGYQISMVEFLISGYGSPIGTLYVRIRKVSDDSIIETSSDTIDVSTLTSNYTWQEFSLLCSPNEEIYVSIEYTNGDADNFVRIRYMNANVCSGVSSHFDGTWTDNSNLDFTIKILYLKAPKENAVDESTSTFWQPKPVNEAGAWISWNMGMSRGIEGCKIYWGADGDYRPTEYKIYTSPNNSDWTERKHEEADPTEGWKEYTWTSVAAQYVKLIVTTHGAVGTKIYEIQINITDEGFLGSSDTPSTYAGQASKTLKVNAGETAVEFVTSDIPSGTKMLFFQAAAPVGWTQDASQNDKVLRVVSGVGGGTGGNWTISGLSTNSTGSHSHSHNHSISFTSGGGHSSSFAMKEGTGTTKYPSSTSDHTHAVSGSTGSDATSGGSHSHTVSADGAWRPAYIDIIIATKD